MHIAENVAYEPHEVTVEHEYACGCKGSWTTQSYLPGEQVCEEAGNEEPQEQIEIPGKCAGSKIQDELQREEGGRLHVCCEWHPRSCVGIPERGCSR